MVNTYVDRDVQKIHSADSILQPLSYEAMYVTVPKKHKYKGAKASVNNSKIPSCTTNKYIHG